MAVYTASELLWTFMPSCRGDLSSRYFYPLRLRRQLWSEKSTLESQYTDRREPGRRWGVGDGGWGVGDGVGGWEGGD